MALIWFLLCYGSKDRKNRSLTKEDRQPEQFRQRSEAKGSVAESLTFEHCISQLCFFRQRTMHDNTEINADGKNWLVRVRARERCFF
jgi:hypothetical protein